MSIPQKKLKTGFSLPVLGLGTWQMGGRLERDINNDDQKDINGIRSAIEHGLVHIDTAEMYADGYTETLVAEAISSYDREKLFLVSKVKGINLSYDNILAACERSLERLKTPYLDLYLLHRFNAAIPLKESMRALDELVASGKVKHIGVANFGPEHLAEAQSYTKNKIVCDQVYYSLSCREPEDRGLLQYCQQHDVFLVAWRPIDKGALLENVPAVLQQVCKKYQKTPAQVAINWLISQDNVVTISKTSSLHHLEENVGAVGWNMDLEDIELLRKDYPHQVGPNSVVPLS